MFGRDFTIEVLDILEITTTKIQISRREKIRDNLVKGMDEQVEFSGTIGEVDISIRLRNSKSSARNQMEIFITSLFKL